MSDQDFQYQVLDRLGRLHADVASIQTDVAAMKDHLKTLNGKVVEQEGKIAENRDYMIEQKAKEREGATWTKRLEPIAYVLLTVLAVLALQHSEQIKNVFLK